MLAPSARVNINSQVLSMYLEHLLPEIASPGDDHNYGSSAMNDVTALQVRCPPVVVSQYSTRRLLLLCSLRSAPRMEAPA